MGDKARHLWDQYATHQPVLYEALLRTDGPVIEFGCGYGSTPLLHRYCERHKRRLLTIDTSADWLDKFYHYSSRLHWIVPTLDWKATLSGIVNCSVAFVDQEPWEARWWTIQAIKDKVKFIVLHDCDYFPAHGLFGESITPIKGPGDTGERSYDDVFKYWREYFPLEPWPYPVTGPPTLLGSNFEPCDWDIDFARYQYEEDFV